MILAPSFDHIHNMLNEESFRLEHGLAEGFPDKTKTVGFIIFDQNFYRFPIQDLIGNLDMLNLHSGTDIHFYLCGVSKYGTNEDGAKHLGELNGVSLYHNARASYSFVEAFEGNIPGWTYNLGFDLVLIDVKESCGQRELDFSSVVYFRVEELIKLNIVERPTELLGKLVKFAREGRVSTAAEFRDELRIMFGGKWFLGLILAMFPKRVRRLAHADIALLGGDAATG